VRLCSKRECKEPKKEPQKEKEPKKEKEQKKEPKKEKEQKKKPKKEKEPKKEPKKEKEPKKAIKEEPQKKKADSSSDAALAEPCLHSVKKMLRKDRLTQFLGWTHLRRRAIREVLNDNSDFELPGVFSECTGLVWFSIAGIPNVQVGIPIVPLLESLGGPHSSLFGIP